MTFDVTGLLIFLLAIVPGFLAQQARSYLVPRSLRTKSVLEETGNYVLNSILVHLLLFGSFSLVLGIVRSPVPSTLGVAMAQKQLSSWACQHRYLIVFYYLASLLLGSVLGAIRGISERDRRIGTWLADNRWLARYWSVLASSPFLKKPLCGTRHCARKPAMSARSLK